jgi:predicted RNase H-like HicB family nuclease
VRYVAFIYKDPESAYGVVFPDLPGCFSAGDTLDEASANAVEALSSHIRWMEADGDPVPEPRGLDEIVADPTLAEEREGAALVLVPLVRDLGSTTRINVSLDFGLLKAIDDEARQRGQTRSAFIASAVRKELMDS